jgi:GT2 family glycosyltransferase
VSAPPRDAGVTVVIVNYRSYSELSACLVSLERSTAPIHTVVVDQQSDTAGAAAIAARFPTVRLIPQETNTGFAAGVNRGVRDASTRYVLLLNPDAVVEPDLCQWLSDWMDGQTDAGAAGPRIRNADGSVQASARRFPDFTTAVAGRSSWLTRVAPDNVLSRRNLPGLDLTTTDVMDIDWVSGACMMIRRSAFDAVGGMDEGFFLYWEDADFCRRLAAAGWRTVYHPRVGATHTGGRSSRHASDLAQAAFHRSAFRLFWKHASAPERLLAPIVFVALRLRLAFVRYRARARERGAAIGQAS